MVVRLIHTSHTQGVLRGGKVTNYLLEKSRVTGQAEGERCFHVLHYLLEGANALEREEYQLLPERWVGLGWVGLRWGGVGLWCDVTGVRGWVRVGGSLSVGGHGGGWCGRAWSLNLPCGLARTPPPSMRL